MSQDIPKIFQIFYAVVPPVGALGNAIVVYVTLRSKSLRSPCNILIALLSIGDAVQLTNATITMLFYTNAENNRIRQDLCAYLEMIPIFSSCLALMVLLNIAIDRLLSLTSFYGSFISRYSKLYIMAHITPACVFAFSIDVLVLFSIKAEEVIFCNLTSVMQGLSNELFFKANFSISVLVIVCYAQFVFFLGKIRMSNEATKGIYRSLFIISFSVICGTFMSSLIIMIGEVLRVNVDRTLLVLFAGAFRNTSFSINFFVYYVTSKLYREEFDKHLGIGFLKNALYRSCLTTGSSNVSRTGLHTIVRPRIQLSMQSSRSPRR
ncbi:hypothetical protein V3C99_000799 [Haemonchus contortus]